MLFTVIDVRILLKDKYHLFKWTEYHLFKRTDKSMVEEIEEFEGVAKTLKWNLGSLEKDVRVCESEIGNLECETRTCEAVNIINIIILHKDVHHFCPNSRCTHILKVVFTIAHKL